MKKTIERVKKALEIYPKLRDNDKELVVKIWDDEIDSVCYFNDYVSYENFTDFYFDGTITSESTIRRARRKVQELYPELRGKKWHERHAQQEPIKKELGYE